jgi:hypothetical protein
MSGLRFRDRFHYQKIWGHRIRSVSEVAPLCDQVPAGCRDNPPRTWYAGSVVAISNCPGKHRESSRGKPAVSLDLGKCLLLIPIAVYTERSRGSLYTLISGCFETLPNLSGNHEDKYLEQNSVRKPIVQE